MAGKEKSGVYPVTWQWHRGNQSSYSSIIQGTFAEQLLDCLFFFKKKSDSTRLEPLLGNPNSLEDAFATGPKSRLSGLSTHSLTPMEVIVVVNYCSDCILMDVFVVVNYCTLVVSNYFIQLDTHGGQLLHFFLSFNLNVEAGDIK